jgi:hypothetical protein
MLSMRELLTGQGAPRPRCAREDDVDAAPLVALPTLPPGAQTKYRKIVSSVAAHVVNLHDFVGRLVPPWAIDARAFPGEAFVHVYSGTPGLYAAVSAVSYRLADDLTWEMIVGGSHSGQGTWPTAIAPAVRAALSTHPCAVCGLHHV